MQLSPTDARDLARDLAKQFATRADEADRLGKLPCEDIRALRASGYPALNVPHEFGNVPHEFGNEFGNVPHEFVL